MFVLEYKRRFNNLSMFSQLYVPTEQHMIKKFRDGFRQKLKHGLITLQFKIMRDLTEATQALEACIRCFYLHVTKHYMLLIANYKPLYA